MHDPAPILFAPVFLAITGLIGTALYLFGSRMLRMTVQLHDNDQLRHWIAGAPAIAWSVWVFNVLMDRMSDASNHALWPLELMLGVLLWFGALGMARLWLGAMTLLSADRRA